MLPLIAMCDRWDIGGLSTNLHPQTGGATIFIYDGHPGGIGITRTAFARFEELCRDAHRLIAECPCASGCPSCVQSPKCGNLNEPLSKAGARLLLERMLGAGGEEVTEGLRRGARGREPLRTRRVVVEGIAMLSHPHEGGARRPGGLPRADRPARPRVLAPAPASAAGFQFGLADYEPATFSDPRVAQLGIHIARDVVPWNVVSSPRDLAAVTAWLAAVKKAGITPMITFQHADGNDRAPTQAQFLKDFLRFRALFPWVTEFCPWDEATHAGQPTARRPRLAAAVLQRDGLALPRLQVTAPDTLDADGNIEAWIGQFLRTARPYPRVWPLNPYISVATDNPRPIRRLLAYVHGQVWFCEVGGIVWWRFHGRLIYHGEAYAVKSTKNIFRLASLSPRITRVYYYHWRSPGRRSRRRSRPGTRG